MKDKSAFKPGIGVDNKQKPYFEQGQPVKFDTGGCKGYGHICGLASQHIIDIWMIHVTESDIDKTIYPWAVIQVPHTMIKNFS